MVFICAGGKRDAIDLSERLRNRNHEEKYKDEQDQLTAAALHSRLRYIQKLGLKIEQANRIAERGCTQGLRSRGRTEEIHHGGKETRRTREKLQLFLRQSARPDCIGIFVLGGSVPPW